MSSVLELNPAVADKILKESALKGVSVEVYLKEIASKNEDDRIKQMREAVNDELFMADLTETMNDFQHTDFDK
jgi:hypothetical protein